MIWGWGELIVFFSSVLVLGGWDIDVCLLWWCRKTLQTIALCVKNPPKEGAERKGTLIVAPAALLQQVCPPH